MLSEYYDIQFDSSESYFFFYSEGSKGRIIKVVRFKKVGDSPYYHLGFGDLNEEDNSINDITASDNKDMNKIFTTIAAIVLLFISENPEAWIYAKANSPVKTRLYRIMLSKNLEMISTNFQLYGSLKGFWKPFRENSNYTAFLIKRKKND